MGYSPEQEENDVTVKIEEKQEKPDTTKTIDPKKQFSNFKNNIITTF